MIAYWWKFCNTKIAEIGSTFVQWKFPHISVASYTHTKSYFDGLDSSRTTDLTDVLNSKDGREVRVQHHVHQSKNHTRSPQSIGTTGGGGREECNIKTAILYKGDKEWKNDQFLSRQ